MAGCNGAIARPFGPLAVCMGLLGCHAQHARRRRSAFAVRLRRSACRDVAIGPAARPARPHRPNAPAGRCTSSPEHEEKSWSCVSERACACEVVGIASGIARGVQGRRMAARMVKTTMIDFIGDAGLRLGVKWKSRPGPGSGAGAERITRQAPRCLLAASALWQVATRRLSGRTALESIQR